VKNAVKHACAVILSHHPRYCSTISRLCGNLNTYFGIKVVNDMLRAAGAGKLRQLLKADAAFSWEESKHVGRKHPGEASVRLNVGYVLTDATVSIRHPAGHRLQRLLEHVGSSCTDMQDRWQPLCPGTLMLVITY
jgi:hypothetical protein